MSFVIFYMKNKRGLGHIEAILAFVLFIGFLIFAFYFFSPFSGGNRLLDSSIDYAFREININTSIDMESYSVVINNDVNLTGSIAGIQINTGVSNARVKVEDSQGNEVSSGFSEGIVYFEKPENNFTIIRFSEDFIDGGEESGTILTEENYSISSSERKKLVSEKKFLELNSSYYGNYLELKKYFNLPNRVDFGFILEFSASDRIVAERPIPENLEVISNRERVEVIRNENGDIVFADLIIMVW